MAKQSVLIPLCAFAILVGVLGLGFTLSDHNDLPAQRRVGTDPFRRGRSHCRGQLQR